ncbi:hypothetical protein [Luteolibacter soli]|uniref:Uncharacterized protein n=1 Tax=Luteolibacter soli TaxID=3135280 RepID=A0ABU9AQQ7_9BACT
MEIPHILWFAVTASCLAGCIAWHRKSPSRPLVITSCGLCWMLLLSLPGLYASFFGYRELSRYADALFAGSAPLELGFRSSGALLVFCCSALSRAGTALLAFGLWKLGSALTPEAEKITNP